MCVYTSASIDSRNCLHSKRSSWLHNREIACEMTSLRKVMRAAASSSERVTSGRDFLASPKTKPCNESHVTQLNAFARSPSKYQIASSHSNKSSAENMCAQHRRAFVRSLSLAKFIKQKNIPSERRRVENGKVKCIRGFRDGARR